MQVAREAVHLAVCEDAALRLAAEAVAAVGDVAHVAHCRLEAADHSAALAVADRDVAHLPVLAHRAVAAETLVGDVARAGRVLAALPQADPAAEDAEVALALAHLRRLGDQLVAVEKVRDPDLLAAGEGSNRADDRHPAHDQRPALVEVADR